MLNGLDKLEEEAQTRAGKGFVKAGAEVQLAICSDFAKAARKDAKKDPGRFFSAARVRVSAG